MLGWVGESTTRCRRTTLAVRCRLCSGCGRLDNVSVSTVLLGRIGHHLRKASAQNIDQLVQVSLTQ